jgi:hypothetical protein
MAPNNQQQQAVTAAAIRLPDFYADSRSHGSIASTLRSPPPTSPSYHKVPLTLS